MAAEAGAAMVGGAAASVAVGGGTASYAAMGGGTASSAAMRNGTASSAAMGAGRRWAESFLSHNPHAWPSGELTGLGPRGRCMCL